MHYPFSTSRGFSKSFGAQVSEIMDPEAGHVHRDGVVLACEVLECCPWFEFADLDVYGNTTEEEADDLSTDPDELLELGMHAVMISCLTQQCAPCCVVLLPTPCFVDYESNQPLCLVINECWHQWPDVDLRMELCGASRPVLHAVKSVLCVQRMEIRYHLKQMRSSSTAFWLRLACTWPMQRETSPWCTSMQMHCRY